MAGARPGGQSRAAGSPMAGGVGAAGRHFGAVSAGAAAWSPEERQRRGRAGCGGIGTQSSAWAAGSHPVTSLPFLRALGEVGPTWPGLAFSDFSISLKQI